MTPLTKEELAELDRRVASAMRAADFDADVAMRPLVLQRLLAQVRDHEAALERARAEERERIFKAVEPWTTLQKIATFPLNRVTLINAWTYEYSANVMQGLAVDALKAKAKEMAVDTMATADSVRSRATSEGGK